MDQQRPRISITKLGEYIIASPLRRQRILEDQAQPRDFVVARYRRARRPIVRALTRGSGIFFELEAAKSRLRQRTPKSDWDENDLTNSIAALEAFLEHRAKLTMGDGRFRPKHKDAGIHIEGVYVSVRPDLILWSGVEDKHVVGAAKLYFGKTTPLTNESGAYISTVLRRYLESRLPHRTISPALCQVFDVLAHQVHAAPRAYKRTMKQIEAACRDIRHLWDRYQVPPKRPTRQPPHPDQPGPLAM